MKQVEGKVSTARVNGWEKPDAAVVLPAHPLTRMVLTVLHLKLET